MKLISRVAAIGSALLMVSAPASAIVTSWDYSVSSLFTAATYTGTGGTTATLTKSLTWGIPTTAKGQSSLDVGNSPAKGSIDTYLGSSPPATSPYLAFSGYSRHTCKNRT